MLSIVSILYTFPLKVTMDIWFIEVNPECNEFLHNFWKISPNLETNCVKKVQKKKIHDYSTYEQKRTTEMKVLVLS